MVVIAGLDPAIHAVAMVYPDALQLNTKRHGSHGQAMG